MGALRDDLIAAKALIDTPEKWKEGWLNGDDEGRYTVDQAVRAAAIKGGDRITAIHGMCEALSCSLPSSFIVDKRSGLYPYIQYLDQRNIRHLDIMALFDRAIAAASPSQTQPE